MTMSTEATFQQLIDMCNKVGWDNGIENLKQIVRKNEELQAYCFAGDYKEQKKAQKLAKTIIQQNITIARLKEYKLQNKL